MGFNSGFKGLMTYEPPRPFFSVFTIHSHPTVSHSILLSLYRDTASSTDKLCCIRDESLGSASKHSFVGDATLCF